jgi:hypothetical protein
MNTRPFTRSRGGRVEMRLAPEETDLIRPLFEEMLRLIGEPAHPDDLRRLFPPAYEHDDAAQEEFAHFTRDDLVEAKRRALTTADATFDKGRWKRGLLSVALSEEEQQAWLGSLNDLRLYLGTRLDVTEDVPGAEESADPGMRLYLYLGWLQQHLVDALLG